MATRFFRAGVGTVTYDESGNIAIFRRTQHPAGIWQFQQGGIDAGETPEQTLWRELSEEVGLQQADITVVTPLPHWTVYEDVKSATDPSIQRIGQTHRWFFLQLHPASTIDLSKATDKEFDDWRWSSFEEIIALTGSHKRHVYETLHRYFVEHIFKT